MSTFNTGHEIIPRPGTARRVRGRTTFSDLFFPLVFLHWGHWENWLWSSQIGMVSAALLAAVLVSVAATGITSRGSALAAAVTVAALALALLIRELPLRTTVTAGVSGASVAPGR